MHGDDDGDDDGGDDGDDGYYDDDDDKDQIPRMKMFINMTKPSPVMAALAEMQGESSSQ